MIHILTNWIIEPYDDLNRCRKCVWQNSTPIWLLSLSKTAHNLSVGCVSPRVSLVFWEGLYPVYTVCISFFTMAHSWILSCVSQGTYPETWDMTILLWVIFLKHLYKGRRIRWSSPTPHFSFDYKNVAHLVLGVEPSCLPICIFHRVLH